MAFDVLILHGEVQDGRGNSAFHADIGIQGDRIAAIGDLAEATAHQRIDASNLVVCPGFVDSHSHGDLVLGRPDHATLLSPLVCQGITTFVGGNCGVALAPLAPERLSALEDYYQFFVGGNPLQDITWTSMGEMLDTLGKRGSLVNFGVLAPHGVLRVSVMGDRPVPANADDLRQMEHLLDKCLEEGALGMSAGLQYFPGSAAATGELVALGRVVGRRRRTAAFHLRSYNDDTLGRAIDEVVHVCREAECPTRISHLFWLPNYPRRVWPFVRGALRLASALYQRREFWAPIDLGLRPHLATIHHHIRDGLPLSVDAMPTASGFTHLLAFFPPWALQNSRAHVLGSLKDPAVRDRIRHSIRYGRPTWPHQDPDTWSINLAGTLGWEVLVVMSVATERNKPLIGRSIADIARDRGVDPLDLACELLVEEGGKVLVFISMTSAMDPFLELGVDAALAHPDVAIISDTLMMLTGETSHLTYDAFPRFIGDFALRKGRVSLPEAIRRCTSLPARTYRIRDRGEIQVGYKADIVVFDPVALGSRSTAKSPCRSPAGIAWTLVNGHVAFDGRKVDTARLAGEAVRG